MLLKVSSPAVFESEIAKIYHMVVGVFLSKAAAAAKIVAAPWLGAWQIMDIDIRGGSLRLSARQRARCAAARVSARPPSRLLPHGSPVASLLPEIRAQFRALLQAALQTTAEQPQAPVAEVRSISCYGVSHAVVSSSPEASPAPKPLPFR